MPISGQTQIAVNRRWPAGRSRRPLAIIAVLSCVGLGLAADGPQADSGWAVSQPQPVVGGSSSLAPRPAGAQATDPRQRIILHHVLEQALAPPLRAAKTGPPAASTAAGDGFRMAERVTGIDGWRSSGASLPSNAGWMPDQSTPTDEGRRAVMDVDAEPTESADTAAGETEPGDETEPGAEAEPGEAADANSQGEAAATEGEAAATAEPQPPLTQQLINLRTRVRNVLRGYYQKPLNSREHDPWEVMHGMLAYGVHSRIRQGGPRGEPITAVGWLCYNRPCKNLTLLYVTPEDELRAKQGVGLQGHMGQLLAMLAQCHVSTDYPIRVGEKEFTIQDLIAAEQKTCYAKSELTFKLIAFSHYLELDATWVNDQGLDWDMPRLIREELAQPIRGAACGGTHRLAGLSLAVKARQKAGLPLDGEYARAAKFIQDYQNYAFRLQNRDGSLSTQWFQGRGDESDIDRRVKTTGHILEWLIYSLDDEQLRDQRTIRAMTYLTNLLSSNYNRDWEVGPMCHALHALLLYDERVFEPFDGANHGGITAILQPARTGNRGSGARR
jgi:hypothetical protein